MARPPPPGYNESISLPGEGRAYEDYMPPEVESERAKADASKCAGMQRGITNHTPYVNTMIQAL